MSARYVIRFDDVCSTMRWKVWSRVEAILTDAGVVPMLAVVPDNRDPKLVVDAPAPDFWDRVRRWQARGWTIGWHGYQHQYCSPSAGLIGIRAASEFAGLPEAEQRAKLTGAAAIFHRERVTPKAWIAPGHTFDETTVRLLSDFGVRIISDGFFWRPVNIAECLWLPQQLWRFRRMPFGTWTVCLHVNNWSEGQISGFAGALKRFAGHITSVDALLREPSQTAGALDRAFAGLLRSAVRFSALRRRPSSA